MNGDAVGTGEAAGLGVALLVIAVLYAAVGQAGASGYLAVMGLSGFGPAAMKTTALALNVVVAGIGTWRFWRAGLLTWRTFYPFGVLGIPSRSSAAGSSCRGRSTSRRSERSCCWPRSR